MSTTVSTFRSAHLWLIIPFVIAILGFMRSYYLDFSNAIWHHHMHGLSATLWYILVIVQPYLVTRGKLREHRFYGMIGLILAGGVTFSALTIIPRNLQAAATVEPNPFVDATFFYGVTFLDLLTITGFVVSVIMAIKKVKNLEDHALWMISTVFWALMPAFGRLAVIPVIAIGGMPPAYNFVEILLMSVPFCLIPIVIIGYKFKTWHPALIAVFFGNLVYAFAGYIGSNETWRGIADVLLKY
jgi:hypothetical protein